MDNLFLTGPSGTTLNLGSWLRPYDKPDYGAKGLIQTAYSETPLSEGGALSYEHVGVRRMAFPLILPSSGSFGGLAALEAQLRLVARPGAVIDLQPEGMSDAVRFDVNHGRWEEDFDTYENRVLRRKGTLYLDTQPLGYLPTLINVSSVASMAIPGQIDLSGVSFIGDAPGLAELTVQATAATNYISGTFLPDLVAWSLGGRASMQAWWPAGSMIGLAGGLVASHQANSFAQTATILRVSVMGQTLNQFDNAAFITIPTALEPAYRGRFRAYAFSQKAASSLAYWGMAADAVPSVGVLTPMASGGIVGTVTGATPAFGFNDLGEITQPPTGSGLNQAVTIRVWTGPLSTGIAASAAIDIAGIYLHALDGANGIQTRLVPEVIGGVGVTGNPPSRFTVQGYERRVLAVAPAADLSLHAPIGDALGGHRGGFPMVAQASTSHLDLAIAARKTLATSTPARTAPLSAAVSLSYRPRFYFLHGL